MDGIFDSPDKEIQVMKEAARINRSAALAALFIFASSFTGAASAQERPTPEQVYKHEKLEVSVPDFSLPGTPLPR